MAVAAEAKRSRKGGGGLSLCATGLVSVGMERRATY